MLKNWIKIFTYQVRHNLFFTVLNTLGLSLGISGLIFAMLYWNDEQSYNRWNPEKDKVYQVLNDMGPDMIWSTNVYPLARFLDKMPEIDEYVYLNTWYYDEIVSYGVKKEKIKILDSQKNFFSFFPFEFVSGNIANALPDSGSIAISEDVAQRLFGTVDAVGKEVRYSGRKLVVRGVYKIPGNSSFKPQAVTNLIYETRLKENQDSWGNFNFGLLLKLKNPDDAENVKKKIEQVFLDNRTKKYAKEQGLSLEDYIKKNGTQKVILEPLATTRLHSITADSYPEGRGNYRFLLIMMGLSVLILVLSIVNYVNLATANAIKRAKEVGVRKVLGAAKGNIVAQFIFEAAVITFSALLLSLVIVELALPYYNSFLNKNLSMANMAFYWQLLLIFLIVIAVAGVFPAVYLSNFETLKVLRGNFSRSKSGVWVRNAMLVLQFAIAAFFVIGSYIIYQQVYYMTTKDLGLNGDQVIAINYRKADSPDAKVIFSRYEAVKQQLQKIKGVEAVSGAAFKLGDGASSSSSFNYNNKNVQGQNMAVDFEFLDMMGIKLAQGRKLSEKSAIDTVETMMVNQTAARMMGEINPVGKVVNWNDKKLRIVGVTSDFHMYGPQAQIPPMSFFHFKTVDWMSYNMNTVYVKVSSENMEQTIADIEKFWNAKVDTEYPFEYDFVNKVFARTYQDIVSQRNLFALLNLVVISIAIFGLFALASFSIQRRMKEIAIRKTLGADTSSLLSALSRQYVVFCTIGFVIAVFPAWYLLDKWLQDFAFRIDISVWPFIVGFVLLMLLTLCVVLLRAYAATRVHIVKYLKYE